MKSNEFSGTEIMIAAGPVGSPVPGLKGAPTHSAKRK